MTTPCSFIWSRAWIGKRPMDADQEQKALILEGAPCILSQHDEGIPHRFIVDGQSFIMTVAVVG